jgi:hypothetical protein
VDRKDISLMQHFRDRNDLVNWLETQPLRKAISRALDEGTAEVIGAFNFIPASREYTSYPGGWIVRITSIHRRTWILAISPLMTGGGHPYWIRVIPEIPWEYWAGRPDGGSLCNGDHPEKYRRLKDESV